MGYDKESILNSPETYKMCKLFFYNIEIKQELDKSDLKSVELKTVELDQPLECSKETTRNIISIMCKMDILSVSRKDGRTKYFKLDIESLLDIFKELWLGKEPIKSGNFVDEFTEFANAGLVRREATLTQKGFAKGLEESLDNVTEGESKRFLERYIINYLLSVENSSIYNMLVNEFQESAEVCWQLRNYENISREVEKLVDLVIYVNAINGRNSSEAMDEALKEL